MRIHAAVLMSLFLFAQAPIQPIHGQVLVPPVIANDSSGQPETEMETEVEAYRSGRGSYRSPAGTYTGGTRTGVNPGTGAGTVRSPGTTGPVNRTPATVPGSRYGGFFGGLFAGTFLGSLLNPLGFGWGGMGMGGVSIIGLLFWAVVIFAIYRLIRMLWRGGR